VSYANAQLAVEAALATALGVLPVQWPNGPQIVPSGAAYVEVYHLPGPTSVDTLGQGGRDVVPQTTQINYYAPLETGNAAGAALVDTLRAAFKAGYWATQSGQSVLFTSCGPGPSRKDGSYFLSIIDIQWEARITR